MQLFAIQLSIASTELCELVSSLGDKCFFLKVTSVALVSAYSLAWHCVNTVARAVVRFFP